MSTKDEITMYIIYTYILYMYLCTVFEGNANIHLVINILGHFSMTRFFP